MKVVPFLTLSILLSLSGCAHRWVLLTESETTEYFFDTQSPLKSSEFTWEVRERFLDKNSDRWYMEADVQYDCRERTFMTLRVRGFSEHRPERTPGVIAGNTPVVVTPGSKEEARLQAICAIVAAGKES
ncbi:MAG: hypothetical protein ABIF09_16635 [Gemmatimonadota bacterium]